MGRQLAVFMQDYDLILTPTLAREPAPIGELDLQDDRLSLDELIERFHSYSPFTALFNASGQPAMSVPLYWSAAGLPMGAHLPVVLVRKAPCLHSPRSWSAPSPGAVGYHRSMPVSGQLRCAGETLSFVSGWPISGSLVSMFLVPTRPTAGVRQYRFRPHR